jgi:hypothetical protein
MGDRNSYLGLLRMEEVRAELKVSEEQGTRIREAGEALRDSLPPPEIDFANLRDAEPEEREAAMAKLREHGAKVEAEARAKLAGILDEAQMKRLRGLWVQRAGAIAALNDAAIATELKLSDDQKKTLAAQRDEQRGQFGGRRRGEGGPPPGGGGGEGAGNFLERMQQARKEAEEKALGVLNDEQKAAFSALKGDAFQFPQPEFGRDRGGRGRDGGDGERRERPNGGPVRDSA